MTTLSRLSLAFVSLCLPLSVAAAAPGNVTGITASLQGGKVLVTWTPVSDPSISAYRVFYSHASILSNDGAYDDYDTVDGSVNSYTLANTPTSSTVFVSVLAMNSQGEESPYFAEEASVQLNSNGSVGTPVIPASSTPTTSIPAGSPQQLLSVRTLSATGVELTFSQAVTIDPQMALQAFTIENGSGQTLTITRLTVEGMTVRLDTLPQQRGIAYVVIIGSGVSGTDPATGAQTTMDENQSPMLFSGDPSGTNGGSAVSSTAAAVSSVPAIPSGADVAGFSLRAQSEGKNLYTIQASWQAPQDSTLAGFRIQQTTDGGETFGNTRTLDQGTSGVTVPHVPAGSFGLRIQAVYIDGTVSNGVQKIVDLPKTDTTPVSPIGGSVVTKPGKPQSNLPQSGPGLLLVLTMTGAATGYAVMKRRNAVAA